MDSIKVVAESIVRKAYVKPQVGIVSLVPKQTVLGNCFSQSDDRSRDLLTDPCALAVDCKSGGY